MKRRATSLVVLVGLCVVAAGCSSGHGGHLPPSSLSRSAAAGHGKSTTTSKPHSGSTTTSSTTTTTGVLGSTGTTGNTGNVAPTGNTGNADAPLPCPDVPSAALTSSPTGPAPVTGNSGAVPLTVTGSGTFTNPSAYPVLMNVNLVVSSQSTPNGPTQTTEVPVSATDPNDAGLLAGPITIDWQANTTVNEYPGGQPTVTVSAGWTYSIEPLVQCDQ